MNRKRLTMTVLVLLSLGTIIGVYAGTVGVNNLFGFDNITADVEYYRNGVNYTQFIASRYGSDQSLNTTDGVTFADVTAGEYFLNAVNKTDIFAYPQQDYSYTIFTEGATYFAKNGTTGAIDYSGANFNLVLNQTYDNTPVYGTIYLKGNFTFTTPLEILKSINIISDGNITVSNTDFLIIGDAANFVIGYNINLNMVDGLNKTTNGIVLRSATAGNILFNHIRRFDNGIYLDPIGTGCGENNIVGGWIAACNIGIGSNPTAPNVWAQGNRIEASIYSCYDYGIYLNSTATIHFQYTHFKGTVDCLVGVYPPIPAAGGGVDIYDSQGKNFWEILYSVTGNYTIVGSSRVIGEQYTSLGTYATYFQSTMIKKSATPAIGINDAYGAGTNTYLNINQFTFNLHTGFKPPQYTKIVIGGSFAGGENITVAVQYNLVGGGTGAAFERLFNSTGTYYLTNGEMLEMMTNDARCYFVASYAKTTEAVTNVTVTVTYAVTQP